MKTNRIALLAVAGLLSISALGIAQSINVPKVSQINAGDLFQDVVNGVPTASSYYATSGLLGNYGPTLPGNNPENWLIGGDATTNLFQRATTGASVTTTFTYGGPDRWAYWSGTATAMTVSQDTTAADLAPAYKAAFKMARTSGQTGVVQMCMAQEIESVNSYVLRGSTAEVDFHAITGANFSPASGNIVVYFISGTGTDEGMQKLAWGLNAGGGGSTAWTGQVSTGVTVSTGGVSTNARYTVAAPIPATATEVGIAICWTPVGTASTNDYVALSGIQLTRNSALTTLAGTAGVALSPDDPRAKAFSRRPAATEALLQQRYFYNISEGAAIQTRGVCHNIDVTHSDCMVNFPVAMRIAPVFTGDGGITAGFAVATTTAGTTLGNCSAVALSSQIASTVASTNNAVFTCTATTVPAAGTVNLLYDNNGSGRIKASAEL